MAPSAVPSPEILAELARTRRRIETLKTAARENRDAAERALDRMAEGWLLLDAEGRIRRANRAALEFLGAPPDPIPGTLLSEWVSDLFFETIRDRAAGCGIEAETWRFPSPVGGAPLRVRSFADSTGFSVFLTPPPLPADESEDAGPDTVFENAERRYRVLLDTLPFIVLIHENRRIVFVNAAGVALLGGNAPADFLGRDVTELVHPDAAPTVRRRLSRLAAGETNPAEDIPLRVPEDDPRTVQAVSTPLREGGNSRTLLVAVDIGARIQAERELAAIFDNSQVGLILLRGGRIVARCNRRLAEILGYDDPETLAGRGVEEFHLSQENFREFGRRYYQSLRDRVRRHIEFPLRRADGTSVWCALSGKALDDASPPDLDRGVLWVVDDISARKAAERALEASENRFRSFFHNPSVGCFLVTAEDVPTFIDINERLAGINGAPRSEHLGKTLGEIVGEGPGPAENEARIRRILRTGERETFESSGRNRRGCAVDYMGHYFPLRDEAGTVVSVAGIVMDITERKRIDRAIRDSEERFRTLVTHSPTGILLSDGRVVRFANRTAARLLGADRPEALAGRKLFDIVAPEFQTTARERIRALLETGTAVAPMEQAYVRTDGSRIPVEVVAVPLDLAEGRLIYSLFQDITERKVAEEALRASLREKEVLLREIHHRVKNNMAVVSGLLEMQFGQVEEPALRRNLQDSHARIRAMSIIHETLYLSENLAEVPLEDYFRNLCDHLFSLYGSVAAGVRLKIDAADVRLDANQAVPVGLAVTELVTNALKYAFPDGRGGNLTIVGGFRPDGWIELRVRDDGAGLPEGFAPETAGTLGMRLVDLLLTRQLHGRWTWQGNDGAEFRLLWPRSA